MVTALVPVANGSEDIEVAGIVDTLRRASIDVTVASVEESNTVTFARGLKVIADASIEAASKSSFDAIAIPGGMPGAERLRDCQVRCQRLCLKSKALTRLLKSHAAQGKLIGAICAAPVVVLLSHGLLDGRIATAHPNFSSQLPDQSKVSERVVVDGNVVTSRGPGSWRLHPRD